MNRYIIIIIKVIILFLALLHTGCHGTAQRSLKDTFSKIAQDNALNMFISCIENPEITGVKLECITGK